VLLANRLKLTHYQPVTVLHTVVRIWSSERGMDLARRPLAVHPRNDGADVMPFE